GESLGREATRLDGVRAAALAQRVEQRPGVSAAESEPGGERGLAAGGEVGEAGPAAFAAADGDGAVLRVDIGQVDGDRLGAAQAATVEEGERAGVPGTSRPGGV